MKRFLKTLTLITVFLLAISGLTAYAAAQKIQKRSTVKSVKAEVSAEIIPVGTNEGGVVTEINVRVGQQIASGTTVATITHDDGTAETVIVNRAGMVKNIQATQNGFVKPQSELMEIIDNRNIFIEADLQISPEDLVKLEVGMPVTITVANTELNGSISTIFPQYDSTANKVSVYCQIENSPAKARLIPGLPATVSLFVDNPAWQTFSPYLKQLNLL